MVQEYLNEAIKIAFGRFVQFWKAKIGSASVCRDLRLAGWSTGLLLQMINSHSVLNPGVEHVLLLWSILTWLTLNSLLDLEILIFCDFSDEVK